MFGIKQYIYIALVLGAISYVWYTDSIIESLKAENESLKKDVLIADVNAIECDETVAEQNARIQNQAVDLNKTKAEFIAYKKLPPKVKIKKERVVIYRDVNVTRQREERSCEDYKNIERNTYFIDWNK